MQRNGVLLERTLWGVGTVMAESTRRHAFSRESQFAEHAYQVIQLIAGIETARVRQNPDTAFAYHFSL